MATVIKAAVGFVWIVAVLMVLAMWESIAAWGNTVMLIVTVSLGLGLGAFVVAWLLRLYDWLADMFANSAHARRLNAAAARLAEAEADRAAAEARQTTARFVTAPADHQAWIIAPENSDLIARPAHLSPGPLNGHTMPPTPVEVELWLAWQSVHSRRQPAGQQPAGLLPAGPVVESLPPALPSILAAQRRLVVGASGSGKSSLAQHIIWAEWLRGTPSIPINPHAEGDEAVADAIETLYLAMDERYKQAAAGHRLAGFSTWHIIVDELTAILAWAKKAKRSEVVEQLQSLIIESRKVQIKLTILGHSPNADDLGLSGPIRGSLSIWQCTGGNDAALVRSSSWRRPPAAAGCGKASPTATRARSTAPRPTWGGPSSPSCHRRVC